MSDHDTTAPAADDELRARLRAYADEVERSTDTEAALQRMPRRSRRATVPLLAIAACFVLAVVVAAVLIEDRRSLDTLVPADPPPLATVCSGSTPPGATTSAGATTHRVGTCEGGMTLAKGSGVELVGEEDLGGQTLDVDAEEVDGKVTGEMRFTDVSGQILVTLECADTETAGLVILGGSVTEGEDAVTGLVALFIQDGDPDRVTIWTEPGGTCADLIEAGRQAIAAGETSYTDVEAGSDIQTG